MGLRQKLKLFAALVIIGWLISPIPEVTLIIGALSGYVLLAAYPPEVVAAAVLIGIVPVYGLLYVLESWFDIEERAYEWIKELEDESIEQILAELGHDHSSEDASSSGGSSNS